MTWLSEPGMVVAIIEIVLGLLLLTRAADAFIEGSVGVAHALRLSPVLVGAVIVGFGTSAPELLVSSAAALDGNRDLGVGNIIGSNVANLSLVLASAAFVVPLIVSRSVLSREAPLSLLAVLAFAWCTVGGLTRWEGLGLLAGLVVALSWMILGGHEGGESHVLDDQPRSMRYDGARTGVGLLGTVAGAQLLVWGSNGIAVAAGLTGGFIGFTLVAVGTSLPEMVTAVVAARKRETELILGNLLGSNMFNSLAVGGVVALISPGPITDPGLRTVGVTVMVIVATGAWVAMVTLRRVHRYEAAALLTGWLVSVWLLASRSGST
ncbi:MAG: sodium:calcium antiporter [Acidimicrobiales bacterium]